MVNNKFNIIGILNIVLIGLLVIFLAYKELETSKKIVCVDSVKLFDGFNMTKEMKRVGEKEFNTRKKSLEVLYSKLQSQKISEDEKKILMQKFIQGKEELEQLNQSFAIEETSKIWSRIQGYTTEFSQDNKYNLIIGSQNKQSVLFADDDIDVTNELLIYINKKYEGSK